MDKILFILTYTGSHGLSTHMSLVSFDEMVKSHSYQNIRYVDTSKIDQKDNIGIVRFMKLEEFQRLFTEEQIKKLKDSNILKQFCKEINDTYDKKPIPLKKKQLEIGYTYKNINESEEVYLGSVTYSYDDFKISNEYHGGRYRDCIHNLNNSKRLKRSRILLKYNNWFRDETTVKLYEKLDNSKIEFDIEEILKDFEFSITNSNLNHFRYYHFDGRVFDMLKEINFEIKYEGKKILLYK